MNPSGFPNLVRNKSLGFYGFILLGALKSVNIPLKTLSAKLKEAMEFLTGQGVPGIIVDLRGNRGGSDDLAAEFAGYFYSETTFYEYQSYYNRLMGEFEIIYVGADGTRTRDIPLNIEPQMPQYGGPVVALVNPVTVSSAEGVAMTIKNLSRGHIVVFWGTNGSFGMTGGKALLPNGYEVAFPLGLINDNLNFPSATIRIPVS
jgi:carboxyl-terminal processing protease